MHSLNLIGNWNCLSTWILLQFPAELSPFTNCRYKCYWVFNPLLPITRVPREEFRWESWLGFAPPPQIGTPGSFWSHVGLSKVLRDCLVLPWEAMWDCEILLCSSWQLWADGSAVVMNYKSYCYRRGEICHYFPIYNSTRSRIRSVWRNPGYTRWYEILVNYKSYCYRRCRGDWPQLPHLALKVQNQNWD